MDSTISWIIYKTNLISYFKVFYLLISAEKICLLIIHQLKRIFAEKLISKHNEH